MSDAQPLGRQAEIARQADGQITVKQTDRGWYRREFLDYSRQTVYG